MISIEYLESLSLGLVETLLLAVVSLILGLLFGITLTIIQLNIRSSLTKSVFQTVIHLLRGLPETFILFVIYFGGSYLLSFIFKNEFNIQPFVAGAIALATLFGVYASKIFQSALQAITQGEWEAAYTLRLSKFQIYRHIVFPQLWRYALPGLGSLWLMVLKDTALISLIGGSDLMSRTQIIVRNTQLPFTYYCLLAGIYLCLTRISEWQIHKLQQHRWMQA